MADELRPAIVRVARDLRHETERLGVTARQATLLWLIRRNPGLGLGELAELERISAPAMSGHVDRLERAGYVERVRSDRDRRRLGLRVTAEGEQLLRRIRTRRTTWLQTRLAMLEDDELAQIAAALPALRRLSELPG